MAFGWDVDDVEDEDEDEVDNSHPYGDDEEYDEEVVDEDQALEEQKPGAGQEEQTEVQVETQGRKKKKDPWDPEVTKQLAKDNDMPDIALKMPCPKCKKMTLYSDKVMPTAIRLSVYIFLACYGAIPTNKAMTAPHFRCMNSKCKSYWKTTGDYFTLEPTGKLERHQAIFHVNK
ncbi:MAG: hypothetical protein IJX25_04205 [Clostridia bacterium]|nr:hypothetical protein [Clostridia bacterium]